VRKDEVTVQKEAVKKVVKRVVKKGYFCKSSVCDLAVRVDDVCGPVDICDIICCEKPMRAKDWA